MNTRLFAFLLLTLSFTSLAAQEKRDGERRKRHFSPEEFQAKQREFITNKAKLSQAEADAYFPLFFEFQKKKFEIEHNARKKISRKRGEKMTEEQCHEYVNSMADAKIEIATLEKEYIKKYLEAVSSCKLLEIQRAEWQFQRELMKKMTRNHEKRGNQNQKR